MRRNTHNEDQLVESIGFRNGIALAILGWVLVILAFCF